MKTSISKTRQNLFALVDRAAKGEKVEFVHKGLVFAIVPVARPGKLARLRPVQVLPEGTSFDDLERGRKELRKEIALSWDAAGRYAVIAYLDTNTVLFLAHGELKRISKRARQAIERHDLLLSPMVMLELAYLHESGRIAASADAVFQELYRSIDLRICPLPFDRIVETAASESWTRDVFDRLVVSHAKANNQAPLISSDDAIAAHYPNVIW